MYAASGSCRTCAMGSSIDPSQWTYTDYVGFLNSHGFHNLNVLDRYLTWGLGARNSPAVRQPEFSRTTLLEFNKSSTRVSDLSDLTKLRLLLREWTRTTKEPTSPGVGQPLGRIVMVENAAPALVDTLGGLLNIDPNFFAGHLDDTTVGSIQGSGYRDYFTIDYQSTFIPVDCPKEAEGLPLHSKGNYYRRVELIPKQPRQKIALARRKISFYLRPNQTQSLTEPWLAIVLVDPPISTFIVGPVEFGSISPSQALSVVPYQGGYVDFAEMRKPHSDMQHDFRDCRHIPQSAVGNTFDDLIRHWQIQARDGLFNPTASSPKTSVPSLATIVRPCLQLAAAEISNSLLYFSTVLTASSPASICTQHPIPNTTTLQRALSRTIAIDALLSQMKVSLTQTKDFACSSTSANEHIGNTYRNILSNLHAHRSTTDAAFSHLTALLNSTHTLSLDQLNTNAETSKSHLRLLTILALIYVPLSLACLIFSLPGSFLPSSGYIYGFLPVSLGVVLLFVLFGVKELRQALLTVKDRICGGFTKKEVLAGERFKVHRETGEKVWVNRPKTELGLGPYTMGGGELGEVKDAEGMGHIGSSFAMTNREQRSPSSARGSSKGRAKTKIRERKREAWDEV